jgi:outer membrane protease
VVWAIAGWVVWEWAATVWEWAATGWVGFGFGGIGMVDSDWVVMVLVLSAWAATAVEEPRGAIRLSRTGVLIHVHG